MELPIPRHLVPYLVPQGEENDEFRVTGKVRCTCGCEAFRVLSRQGGLVTELNCKSCGRLIPLFDYVRHGWNGFVCKTYTDDGDDPYQMQRCGSCGRDAFGVNVTILSQGKQDFYDEIVADDPSFSLEEWVDAFEWITVDLTCTDCKAQIPGWLDLETM